jgi:hypothetical protein
MPNYDMKNVNVFPTLNKLPSQEARQMSQHIVSKIHIWIHQPGGGGDIFPSIPSG